MDRRELPPEWREAHRRDAATPPAMADPLPERRLARLLAAFVLSGLVFLVAPGTLLGVWNLAGISSGRQLAAVPVAWIQAHGHAQFFGWVGTFLIGISLYTLPKFRGAATRSVAAGWAMWAMWTAAVAMRWWAGVGQASAAGLFRWSAALEFVVAVLLVWQCSARPPKPRPAQPWELPVFGGFGAFTALMAWQWRLAVRMPPGNALPLASDSALISLALWTFAFPIVLGYSAKFFPGLVGTQAARRADVVAALVPLPLAALGFVLEWRPLAAAAVLAAVLLAARALGLFGRGKAKPKTTGVDARYPLFARLAWGWLAVTAALGFFVGRPGMLGASRHAFTVGFLATLIFSIGPRILPSFLSSRELWSPRLMRWSLTLLTAGCALRVLSEPLAYGELLPFAWKVLPVSAFTELAAVLLFAVNIAVSMAAPVPSWFGRKHVNDRMSVYWLVSSYPATRRLLVEGGLATLARVDEVPKSLLLAEAAHADGADPARLVAALGDFFEARLAPSLRQSKLSNGV